MRNKTVIHYYLNSNAGTRLGVTGPVTGTNIMNLEKRFDKIAKWDHDNDCWFVGDVTYYRWQYPDGDVASDWTRDFREAINWIIEFDLQQV